MISHECALSLFSEWDGRVRSRAKNLDQVMTAVEVRRQGPARLGQPKEKPFKTRLPPKSGWPPTSEERGFGRSVSSIEFDELDRASLQYALSLRQTNDRLIAVDLGSGDGIMGARFALVGFNSFLYDLAFPKSVIFSGRYKVASIKKICMDLSRVTKNHLPTKIDVVYSQRALHYLTSEEMITLLRSVHDVCRRQARAFISVAGMNTEIGRSHEFRHAPLEIRHGLPSVDMQIKHSISHPLTIYSADEFAQTVEKSGFKMIDISVSPFGNLKGEFSV